MFKPMLASPVQIMPTDEDEWIAERKLDGWRAIFLAGDDANTTKLYARSGSTITQVPYVTEALAGLPDRTILDGEIVNMDTSFEFKRTQEILKRKRVHTPSGPDDPPLTYMVFDLLELNGTDLKGETLEDRKKLLTALFVLLPDDVPVRLCEELPCTEDSYLDMVEKGWEGAVIKKRDSRYVPGSRNGGWLKCKPDQEVDALCTGTYPPEAGSKFDGNAVGGITFTVKHDDGTEYEGRCAGMDNALREALYQDPTPYVGKVAVIAHGGIGEKGALRFPRLKHFREEADKAPADLDLKPTGKGKAQMVALLNRTLAAQERAELAERKQADLEARLAQAVKRAGGGTKTSGNRRMRNYAAMGEAKLIASRDSLQRGAGEAYERCMGEGSGDPARDLRVVEDICQQKGL